MIRLLSIIGFLTCLAVGMILASKIPVEGTTYPDSTVPFAVVVATSIVFLILWRKSEQSSDYSAEQGSLNSNQVKHILKTSINTLETIHQKGIDNATLTRLETISLDIAKIIDSRISIQKDLGLESVSMLFCVFNAPHFILCLKNH